MSPFDRLRKRPEKRELHALLVKADAARDARDWAAAAVGYAAYLERKPEAAAIRVQLGHMLKETGRLEEALAAYAQAFAEEPGNADTALMIGHLHKRWGNYDEAERFYGAALRLDPTSAPTFRELSALGAFPARILAEAGSDKSGAKGGKIQAGDILIDLSDVFKFLKENDTVSGIQRVQLAMTESLLKTGRADLRVSYLDEDTRAYYTVEPGLILELCQVLKGHGASHDRLKALVRSAEATARPYAPRAGDTVFVAGAFWMLPDVHGLYSWLKEAGVRIGVYIYDIIPVTHPEFCARGLVSSFTRCLFHFLKLADFVFTISDFSGAELTRVFAPRVPGLAPVSTVGLAHEMPASPERGQASARIAPLLDEDYVLFVSTIEARKNHQYLYRAWQQLAARNPDRTLPKLVFVGRKGWRVTDLMESFKDSRYLDGRLQVLRGIADADLALLYKHAKFTCFPSIVEGWGLPIGESLAYGTPCVASNTSSMPEVGGDMVDYIDPFDISGGVRLFEELLFTPGALDQRRQKIAEQFKPVTWQAVAENLLGQIDGHRKRLDGDKGRSTGEPHCRLVAGRSVSFEYSLEEPRLDRVDQLAAVDFAFDERWSWDQDQAKWLIGRTASFDFVLEPSAAADPASGEDDGQPARVPVFLALRTVDGLSDETRLRFTAAGEELGSAPLSGVGGLTVTFTVPLQPDTRRVCFDLAIEGPLPRDSRLRPVSVAVSEMGTALPGATRFFTYMATLRTKKEIGGHT